MSTTTVLHVTPEGETWAVKLDESAAPSSVHPTRGLAVASAFEMLQGRDEAEVERAIEDNVPAPFQQDAHHWLILHGRYVCQARRPRCPICPIRAHCPYEPKTTDPV